jgi:hypothetical protein
MHEGTGNDLCGLSRRGCGRMKNADLKDRAQVNTTVAVWSFIRYVRIRETVHHILCEAPGDCTGLLTGSCREYVSWCRSLLILHFWAELLSMSHDAEMLHRLARHQSCSSLMSSC